MEYLNFFFLCFVDRQLFASQFDPLRLVYKLFSGVSRVVFNQGRI